MGKISQIHGTEVFSKFNRALEEQVSVQFQEYYPPLDEWFKVNAYPSEEGISVFFRDITERKKQQKELQQSLKEKETLLQEIHHRGKITWRSFQV